MEAYPLALAEHTMSEFHYTHSNLHCEAVPLARIARAVGTPVYVYSYTAIRERYLALDQALGGEPHLICYAMKACSNQAILRILIREGAGMDIVSGGELYRALAAGADPQKIIYAGVGKSEEEIEYALRSDVLMLNVESAQELAAIDAIAARLGKRARVALRVNPDVDPVTHPYIATGLKQTKFGMEVAEARSLIHMLDRLGHVEIIGVHAHIGSQITQLGPFVEAAEKVAAFVRELQGQGVAVRYVNLGGGLGIPYQDERPPALAEWADALRQIVAPLRCTLIVEPGRALVGNAAALVTKVLYTKRNAAKRFVVVDAAMNDLIRPSLYGAYHAILPVEESRTQAEPVVVDVVGPVCESGDFLAKDRALPPVAPGDLLAVMSAGAYGFSMASNYNSRPLAAEVLVRGDEFFVIRERQTVEDLIRGERVPAFLDDGRRTTDDRQ
jgi:diaminopimelate decarboxylase